MGLLDPSSWSKEGFAQWTYNTLDPIYGEGAPLEEVTQQVREGDLVGAGLEATEQIFIEPIVDYGSDSVVEPILDTGSSLIDDSKDLLAGAQETALQASKLGLLAIAAGFILLRK